MNSAPVPDRRRMSKKRKRVTPGDEVVIVESWHSDVVPQMRGVVTEKMRGGYFVEIKACFSNARGERRVETRCIFFSRQQLRRSDV